ncbi:MAG: conjugal transfer protein TraB [Methanoculleus sp. SDB]|nr:MAG: conjugal transfer protein TraB [Methanoculleus sp. SDB]
MGNIHIVGTAHVSKKSIEEVKAAMAEFSPDVVAIELDPGRFAALKHQGPEPSVSDVLKGGNFSQLLVQWLLAYLQRRIGMDVGVEPGAEMLVAIEEAEGREIPVALVDRDIRITLMRFWRTMSLWEKVKMGAALAASIAGFGQEEINVDTLTEQDVITAALEEFRKYSPHGARALIDERDAYLAHQLRQLSHRYDRVLGIVGAGHVRGIVRYLENPASIPPITKLTEEPAVLPWAKIIGIGVVLLFASLLVTIAFSGVGIEVLLLALLYWVLVNGTLSAAFTLAAGGHPLSALTAFAVSWLTSLNPLIAAGWFAAITEAKIRKPSTADFQAIMDADSFETLRKVPLFRVVLVAALANVGSTLGTFAYFIFLFPILGIDPQAVILAGAQNLWEFIRVITPF